MNFPSKPSFKLQFVCRVCGWIGARTRTCHKPCPKCQSANVIPDAAAYAQRKLRP